jgi:hypothetical protein
MMVILGVVAVALILQGGKYFKWEDEQGRIHYGDQPPSDVPCEEMAPAPCISDEERARADERARALRDRADELLEQRLQRQEAEREATAERLAARREKCSEAQRRLNWLRQTWGAIIAIPDEEGAPHWISDDERAQRMEDALEDVERWCD